MARGQAEDAGGLTPAKTTTPPHTILAAELYRFSSVSTINKRPEAADQTAAQRSGCGLERRSSGVNAVRRTRRNK